MTLSFRLIPSALLLTAAMVVAPQIQAAPAATEDPAPALVANINSVVDLALGQSPDAITARVPEIRTKMNEMFAIDAIVQRAFGRNWAKLTPEQKTEAVDLLGRLVIRTYASQLSSGDRPVITVISSKKISDDRREIVSTAAQQGKTVNVIYRLAPIDGKWKVYDVLAENVSVVGNYRQQFDTHFEKKSADDLFKLLREKLAAPIVEEKTK